MTQIHSGATMAAVVKDGRLGGGVMRQVRIKKDRMTNSRSSQEHSIDLPLDPRDEDIMRAKALRRGERVGRPWPHNPETMGS
jgi:hypothetical protein